MVIANALNCKSFLRLYEFASTTTANTSIELFN